MKQQEAFELLWNKYGLLRAGQLLNTAAILQAWGAQDFDSESSKQNRSKVIAQMREAGVYWDAIEWEPGVVAWWVKVAKRAKRRTA